MGALAWAVAPQVAGHIDGPGAMARALIGLMLAGNWVWLAIITAQALFNTVFGEELLHRRG